TPPRELLPRRCLGLERGVAAGDPRVVDSRNRRPVRGLERREEDPVERGAQGVRLGLLLGGLLVLGPVLVLGEPLGAVAFGADANRRLLLLGLDDPQTHL